MVTSDRAAVRVRDATAQDFEAVSQLWRAADALHARLLPDTFRSAAPVLPRELFERFRRRGAALLVAEVEGVVAGFTALYVSDSPPDPALQPAVRAHVEVLAVAPPYRRRGIGRELVSAADAWARGKGAREVTLTVWNGNQEAQRFYDALGFETLARVLRRRV